MTDNVHIIQAPADEQKPGVWIKHLKGLHNLRYLILPTYVTDDDDLALLPALPTLERLEVSSGKFSDTGMKSIGALTNLRLLKLVDCPGISSAGIDCLGRLKNLESLDLRLAPITDEALQHLAKFTHSKHWDFAVPRSQTLVLGISPVL